MCIRGDLGIDRHLGHAPTVAQVDEDQAALIAAAVDPTGQRYFLIHVINPKFATVVRFQHVDCLDKVMSGIRGVFSLSAGRLPCRQAKRNPVVPGGVTVYG
jgi:hypothetical protein